MLKILSGKQVKELDAAHILRNGISSLELMERAALAFVDWWNSKKFATDTPVLIFCGAGNNGGDGFAIARLLYKSGFRITVFKCFTEIDQLSPDALKNFNLLSEGIDVKFWNEFDPKSDGILIDAFLGVGLKGELRAEAKSIIQRINSFSGLVVSVDIPSGLPSDDLLSGACVEADYTVTFAFPKLSLLFPEHGNVTGELILGDIGIGEEEYDSFDTSHFFLRERDLGAFHRKFHRFSHKGDFGKILILAGSKGRMGAAVLSCKASLRTGTGLVTAFVPEGERQILQVAVPEAMCLFSLPQALSVFDALGVGPGLGLEEKAEVMKALFQLYSKPIVLDADAITLIALHPDLIPLIPKESILTPHLAEFDRFLGRSENHLDRLEKASKFCQKWKLNLLIKGANSVICLSDGRQIFNSSGIQFMATAGSGDVLTGMLTSFLGQGYSPEQAMICGVYQHGLAGEIAGKNKRRGTIATDIIEAIPETFIRLNIS
ncbi:MAG TPA: NAD(P)H-hydrate dehydratase [Algoriphagus sp.]|nr:NAD(P)H-hydrate dehydratase [Algoriphagus sp.]